MKNEVYKFKLFRRYKDEIIKNKEKYRPIILRSLEEDEIDYKNIIDLWEKEWKELPNVHIDTLKFRWDIFKDYKEDVIKDKDRYKPALLELLEQDKVDASRYEEIIDLWEEEWKEKPNIEIDKLKLKDFGIFKKYKEEIVKNKERYKPVLIDIFKRGEYIRFNIRKELMEIWKNEWREVSNLDIDKLKFENDEIFKKYKEEIGKNKERYKPVLLELLEKNKYISSNIYKEIIDIWEKEWKEEPNIYIDKLKFDYWIFNQYKEEIGKNKERYKPILLELLEKNKYISSNIYKEIIDIWEKEWKEEPNIYMDRLKFKWIFKEYKEEIKGNKKRYKPALLEALENNEIGYNIYEDIVEIWEKDWKEEPNIYINKLNIYLDKLKFDWDIFKEYKEEIKENKRRYKPALLEALENNEIGYDIYEDIVEIWEKDWEEEPNIYIDKFKFWNEMIFWNYREDIIKNPKRYKPALLDLILNEDYFFYTLYGEIMNIWEKRN